jgi:hypothetical protein
LIYKVIIIFLYTNEIKKNDLFLFKDYTRKKYKPMSYPILPKNVDVSKLKYSEVRTLTSGAKSIYVNYGSSKLRIQTPVMYMPYGIGEGFEDKSIKNPEVKKNTEKKYDLTLSFKGSDENPKINTFLEKMREIETEIIDKAFENREPWFKDDYDGNKAFVARMFSPMIKIDKDQKTGKVVGKYPPTLRVKIPYDGVADKFNFESYDMENTDIVFTDIITKLKGGKTQLIIELTGIWMAGGKYGCTWKVVSGKFQLSQNNKIVFIEDSDTEKAATAEDENEEEEDGIENLHNTNVNNSDEEKEEKEEEEEEKHEELLEVETKQQSNTRTKKQSKK